jgi:DNA (cytosine-5)-methyltransferase 1
LLRLLDVFSGAGGLALGWLNAAGVGGAQLVAAVDRDPSLRDVFEYNYPDTNYIEHEIDPEPSEASTDTVLEKLNVVPGSIDVLLAGPPCQSLSRAGKRLDHPDNRLLLRVCDIVEKLHPIVFVIENVPEIAWVQDGRLLGRAMVRLGEAGYTADSSLLNASMFGIPQVRLRNFIVGVRSSMRLSLQLHPSATHAGWNSARAAIGIKMAHRATLEDSTRVALPPCPGVADAIDDLPPLEAGKRYDGPLLSQPRSEYQKRLRARSGEVYNHAAVAHSPELVQALATLGAGETPQSMGEHPLRKKDYFRSAYARLHPQGPAPTLTTQTHNPGSGRFTHYRDARVLTVREVARLQGFPDDFRFFGQDETQRRHVGNAVPPLLAEAIARNLIRGLHATTPSA